MKLMLKLIALTLLSSGLCIILSSCHTVEGFGKDMQQGGKELQQAAEQ